MPTKHAPAGAVGPAAAARGGGNRYGYGRIHTAEAIDRALAAPDPYAALGYHPEDTDTGHGCHGTHTLGIAAGNGRAGGPAGVAPEADLVFVELSTWSEDGMDRLGDLVALLEAVDFIVRTAQAEGKPCVINLSMGRQAGEHDGLTLVEQALDAAVNAVPGLAVVHSTGNYFSRGIHACGQLRTGERRSLAVAIDAGGLLPHEIDIWYAGRDRLRVALEGPGGSIAVALGDQGQIRRGGAELARLYHRAADPNNNDNHIDIFISPRAPPGEWRVTLIGDDVVDGRFHAWVERDAACPRCQPQFDPDDVVPASTTGTICNGFHTVAVGAYDPHSFGRPLAPFSSSGPTRDGRQKPDLCAPGLFILAARSAPRDAPPDRALLTRMSGTSMAAPHVTGCIACMFSVAPRPLTIQDAANPVHHRDAGRGRRAGAGAPRQRPSGDRGGDRGGRHPECRDGDGAISRSCRAPRNRAGTGRSGRRRDAGGRAGAGEARRGSSRPGRSRTGAAGRCRQRPDRIRGG